MTTPLLPQAFWFRLSVPCRRVEGIPRTAAGKRLIDLPAGCAVPEISLLDGRPSWAELRVAWNPRGLGLSVDVTGKAGPIVHDPDRPFASDSAQFWIDTRDTRNIHRASRFCHWFSAALVPGRSGNDLKAQVTQRPIHRALASAPICRPEQISARAERLKAGWRLELFLTAEVLHGFDPDTNRRLGFAYQITDPERDDQYLTVGREFPIGEDPSLWSTLELLGTG